MFDTGERLEKKPETIISEQKVFEGQVIDLSLRQAQLVDGTIVSREVVVNKGAVVIVPVTEKNEVRSIGPALKSG